MPQAPPKQGNAGGTSTAVGCDATPNARCGARFGVKLPCAVQCGLAAQTSPDDDEHNTDNDALLLFGHAIVAPVLLSPPVRA